LLNNLFLFFGLRAEQDEGSKAAVVDKYLFLYWGREGEETESRKEK
jgi:hypothetical protein